ncbi:MAG TPA: transglycosylase domain-containing protein [Candidatus Kryptonia bacterium]|nr:transglycosylase domain-containing protein [Candidatus Kryptonia bacterium]
MANVQVVWAKASDGRDVARVEAVTRTRLARAGYVLWSVITAASLTFLLLDWLFPFPLARVQLAANPQGAASSVVLLRSGHLRIPLLPQDVSPVLVRTVVASEDRWFGWHPGINPASIVRAAWANWRNGRVVTGASTIAMQLAQLTEPAPHTVWTKCREAFRAMQLQRHFSLDELLALYLNFSRYGGTIEGAGAASRVYFGKTAAQLSLSEVALLTALPHAPLREDPLRNPERARAARDHVLDRLAKQRVFPQRAIAAARRQPLLTGSAEHAGFAEPLQRTSG